MRMLLRMLLSVFGMTRIGADAILRTVHKINGIILKNILIVFSEYMRNGIKRSV